MRGLSILVAVAMLVTGCVDLAAPTSEPTTIASAPSPTSPQPTAPPSPVATAPAAAVPTERPTIAPTDPPLTFEDLLAGAQRVAYDDLVANGIDYFFKTLYFKGRVVWLVPASSNTYWMGVEVNERGDMLYVSLYRTETFEEADWIELVAPYSGEYAYETEDGEDVTLPSFQSLSEEEIRLAAVAGFDEASLACTDRAHKTNRYRWTEKVWWSFHDSSTPAQLEAADVLEVLERSVSNITDARNDCGLPDDVGATAGYSGETDQEPGINARGRCSESDGRNVVGFGKLPTNTLGLTCSYYFANAITEADITFNADIDWALSVDDCVFSELLEATATHEFGHAFGLDHVGEGKHGDLTMSTASNGPCHAGEITLGLGDVLGLEELY